ncbi:GIY-YIG nuclease family protein [Parasedimentitalea huanghaiensis]|uniref:GIY-YIG nuclease family protein n=1 Tax=Parasedimentitalea huanghaiensis TaxID=2682100 RepID=A0A6L6WJ28_9RHOB|nr:GIY-YIG nuclease family protein [Zongyanglinia huanghaiensis]MVO16979.1 GIY-YIG nuclease family protein [Zongyanglinia huanghaiensis]
MVDVVYVLINQAMPGLVKIGLTSSDVERRMKELDTTGLPLPFECFSAWEVESAIAAEKALHVAFGDHRVRERREFFRISPDKPTAILKAFGLRDVTPSEDVIGDHDDARALERARSRRPRFTFDMVSVVEGSQLHSVFDDDTICTVGPGNNVVFRGEQMSLSQSALIVARETGRNWKTLAGPDYWKFEDETLANLRNVEEAAV